jgi:glycosyltransferase involved in cell wall biosynthesis
MHILFLTDNFPPEVNAPAARTFEHCREWVRAGHKVTVITGAPNFPTGQIFDGYKNRWRSHETIEGIDVIRVRTYITANEGLLKRTLDYASFMVSAVPASLGVIGIDVIVATSPHFFTPCAAYIAGLLKRRPYVFELRDLWPESIRAVGAMKSSRVLDALEAVELFLYRRAAHVVSVTHAFKKNLMGRGVPTKKISVTTNGADLSRFSPIPRDEALAATLGLTGEAIRSEPDKKRERMTIVASSISFFEAQKEELDNPGQWRGGRACLLVLSAAHSSWRTADASGSCSLPSGRGNLPTRPRRRDGRRRPRGGRVWASPIGPSMVGSGPTGRPLAAPVAGKTTAHRRRDTR